MAFLFSMRSTPLNAGHRRQRSAGTLPAISEDSSDFAPPLPHHIPDRPAGWGSPTLYNGSNTSDPFKSDSDSSPSLEKPVEPPRTSGFRRYVTKRGGWWRLTLISLLIVLCLVGLIVGLVVGLRNRSQNA